MMAARSLFRDAPMMEKAGWARRMQMRQWVVASTERAGKPWSGTEQADQRERAHTMRETAVGGDQLHAEFLRKPDVQRVIERQLVASRQADDSLGQLRRGHDEFKLEIVEREERLFNLAFVKAEIMEQRVGHFANQQVWRHDGCMPNDMGIPQRTGLGGIRLIHEPLQSNRGVDNRHYRDSRSLRMTFTLSQPGGPFLRRRSMTAAARSMRAWSRTLPLMSNSTAFVMTNVVYHTPRSLRHHLIRNIA